MDFQTWMLSIVLLMPVSALIGWMATAYQRSSGAWFALAVVFTPLVAFVFLLVADVPHAAVVRRKKEQRARRRHPERTDIGDIALAESTCPRCGAAVNPTTGDGLDSSEEEPWRLTCHRCGAEVQS